MKVVDGPVDQVTATPKRSLRTRPSLHLFLIVLIFAAAFSGYLAVIRAGQIRGYSPSTIVAGRDLALLIPILALFFWLIRSQRSRSEMMILTAAVFLFSAGQVIQYRLFSDPEYGARGAARAKARQLKAQTVRLLNVETGYGDDKKTFMFGAPDRVQKPASPQKFETERYSTIDILISPNTYIPIIAFVAMGGCFAIFKNDKLLMWFQRHAMLIGFATLIPFAAVVLISDEGKFFGQTTPWEAVKILFLLSFAGVLADSYRHLRLTRWGLPAARHLLPFLVIAIMPVLPFFALSDFGQMLVFLGVYIVLYVIAVRSKAQLAYGCALIAVLFVVFFGASRVTTGFGVPGRVYFRFYQWLNTWEAPSPETWWWKNDLDRYLKAKNLTIDPNEPQEAVQRNNEAWADKVLQQSQALFGINEGGAVGEGLGLGFPETVPISDSDFIYAAIAEETGIAGGLAILLGLAALVVAGTVVAISAQDMYTKLFAAGITAFFGLQTVVNIGGVLRLLPMTGITLPFVSHGGWSLITSFAMLGALLALSHRNAQDRKAVETPSVPPRFVPVR